MRERAGVAAPVELLAGRASSTPGARVSSARPSRSSPPLAFWRTRGSRAGRAFYFAGTAYAFHWTDFWGGAPAVTAAGIASFAISTTLFMPLALRTALVFPEESRAARPHCRSGRGCSRRAARWSPAGRSALPFGFAGANEAALALQVASIAVFGARLVQSYRACGPIGRRQLKWVLRRCIRVGLVPALLAGFAALAVPALWWLYEFALGLSIALPDLSLHRARALQPAGRRSADHDARRSRR